MFCIDVHPIFSIDPHAMFSSPWVRPPRTPTRVRDRGRRAGAPLGGNPLQAFKCIALHPTEPFAPPQPFCNLPNPLLRALPNPLLCTAPNRLALLCFPHNLLRRPKPSADAETHYPARLQNHCSAPHKTFCAAQKLLQTRKSITLHASKTTALHSTKPSTSPKTFCRIANPISCTPPKVKPLALLCIPQNLLHRPKPSADPQSHHSAHLRYNKPCR